MSDSLPLKKIAPRSGTPTELMHAYGIDKDAIVAAVKRLLA